MKIKTILILLLLVAILGGFVIAPVILQSFRSSVEPPTSNIIDYRLDKQLRSAFIQGGATILTFEYSFDCENYYTQKGFLESTVNEYKEQLLLEEIFNETLTLSQLKVMSVIGNKTLVDPTEDEIFDTLCEVMVAPPTVCVMR